MRGFFQTEYQGKKGLGLSPELPEAYPHHIQISDIETGYWEAIAFLENVEEHSSEVESLVANFNEKCNVLQNLADEAVESRRLISVRS
jgi:hypothetical protein